MSTLVLGHCPLLRLSQRFYLSLIVLVALIKTFSFFQKDLVRLKMSITTLTSPAGKASRRVRFSLPEAKLTFSADKRTLHGTSKYVNGTLINVTSTIHSANELGKSNSRSDAYKSSLKSNGKEAIQHKVSLNIRPATVMERGRNSLPNTAIASGVANRRRQTKTITRNVEKSFNTLPIIERKSSSLEDFDDEDSLDGDYRDENSCNSRAKPPTTLTRFKSSDDLRESTLPKSKNSVFKLPEASNGSSNFSQRKTPTANSLKVPNSTDASSECLFIFSNGSLHFRPNYFVAPSVQSCESRKLKHEAVLCDKEDRLKASQNSEENLEQFFDFVDKWRVNRLAGNKKIDDIFRSSSCKICFRLNSRECCQRDKSRPNSVL